MQTLGQELVENRRKRYMPQSRLADIMEVPRSTIWRWENDKGKPNYANYMKLRELGLLKNDHSL